MSDQETESFTPYEPQPYAWDYGDEPPKGGERNGGTGILWGRFAVLGGLLLLVFLIGRWSAPNGVESEQLAEVRADYKAAQEEIDELKAALTQPTATVTPTPSVTVGEQDDEAEDATFDGETYIVQSGDTMREIAERYCGDATKDDLIAEFNGIADATIISVGQELQIPEDCGA